MESTIKFLFTSPYSALFEFVSNNDTIVIPAFLLIIVAGMIGYMASIDLPEGITITTKESATMHHITTSLPMMHLVNSTTNEVILRATRAECLTMQTYMGTTYGTTTHITITH